MNHQPVHRQYLTERINKYLKIVSQKTGKHFTSHSFRIGLITALIDTTGISMACKIAGHSDIKTTELYNRNPMTIQEQIQAANKAFKRGQAAQKEQEQRQK
jgi:site-specific recombinase XerD